MHNHHFSIFLGLLLLISVSAFAQKERTHDETILHCIDKIKQYPGSSKYDEPLRVAYFEANSEDLGRVGELRQSGRPEIWYEVYRIYEGMDKRQRSVMQLPDKRLRSIGFVLDDHSGEMNEARSNAAAYFYADASRLLEQNNPDAALAAYNELIKLAGLYSTYRDLDRLMLRAILTGASDIRFELHNQTGKDLNNNIIDELSRLVWQYKRVQYGQERPPKEGQEGNFILNVRLTNLSVTTDKIKKSTYDEVRDIYEGGVLKDSIVCSVSESRQYKSAVLEGRLEYYDRQLEQTVIRIPVKSTSVFMNSFGSLQGNPDAASDETRQLIARKELPYPSSEEIVMDAVSKFTKQAVDQLLVGEVMEK